MRKFSIPPLVLNVYERVYYYHLEPKMKSSPLKSSLVKNESSWRLGDISFNTGFIQQKDV